MSRGLLDTSVFIALEQQRTVEMALPDEVAVSVITLAELELGVLLARDARVRSVRLRTLSSVRSVAVALPIDERTASAYSQLAAELLATGKKPRINDTWIAATAVVNGATVWTQDSGFSDFGASVDIERV